METIDYISIRNLGPKHRALVIQFTGGGASMDVLSSDTPDEVIMKLRQMADTLEAGVIKRDDAARI